MEEILDNFDYLIFPVNILYESGYLTWQFCCYHVISLLQWLVHFSNICATMNNHTIKNIEVLASHHVWYTPVWLSESLSIMSCQLFSQDFPLKLFERKVSWYSILVFSVIDTGNLASVLASFISTTNERF